MINLKHLRKKNNVSQLQIADFLHISPSAVALWELNEKTPSLGHSLAVCRILNCLPEELFCDNNSSFADRSSVPIFTLTRYNDISFSRTASGSNLHFGVIVPKDISGRVKQGDTCYFKLFDKYTEKDIVIALGKNCDAVIDIAGNLPSDKYEIVAVCRFMQSRL